MPAHVPEGPAGLCTGSAGGQEGGPPWETQLAEVRLAEGCDIKSHLLGVNVPGSVLALYPSLLSLQ